MLLSEIDNENLFYFFVKTLEGKFNINYTLKADGIDTKYFDFSFKEFHLTLHYQLYVGIELLPLSFFLEQKPTKKEIEFTEELGALLLVEKKAIEKEVKRTQNE